MQLEAHCVENIKNSREVWLYWIARKRTMKARPRKPRFLRKVGNIVKTGGPANGMTYFGDIRFLERFIYEIGSRSTRSLFCATLELERLGRALGSNKQD